MRLRKGARRICLGVVAAAVALGSGACSSDEGKSVSVDGSEIEGALAERGFTVPASFTFTEGYEVKGFVGAASFGAKYEGAGPFDRAAAEIAEANPKFLALQPILFGSRSCQSVVEVSRFLLRGSDVEDWVSGNGWGLGAVTLILTSDGWGTHLYVRAEGH
ncbi:MAG: hypothetical protein K0Q61_2432 [Rhodococcus erythropolis]|nr:hypothetical protein [Rhodococcus erythropolis]